MSASAEAMPLTESQIDRYSRQIILPELGGIGQERLLASRARLVGEPGLVDWAALYLAAAGVGTLLLPESAAEVVGEIARLEPDCRVTRSSAAVDADVTLALNAIGDVEGRLVIAHARGDEGWIAAVVPQDRSSPCVACLRLASDVGPAEPAEADARSATPPDRGCDMGGAAGDRITTGSAGRMLALLAVTESLKLLLDLGSTLVGRRLLYDAATQAFVQEAIACTEGCKTRSQRRVSAAR